MSQPVRASAAQTSKLGAFALALVALQLKHIPLEEERRTEMSRCKNRTTGGHKTSRFMTQAKSNYHENESR